MTHIRRDSADRLVGSASRIDTGSPDSKLAATRDPDLLQRTKKQDRGRLWSPDAWQKRAIGRHAELMSGRFDFPEDLAALGIKFEYKRAFLKSRHVPLVRAHVKITGRALGDAEQLASKFLFA